MHISAFGSCKVQLELELSLTSKAKQEILVILEPSTATNKFISY